MSNANHTPGPWRIDQERIFTTDMIEVDIFTCDITQDRDILEYSICRIQSSDHVPDGIDKNEAKANARLIAAAPELHDALENLVIAIGMGWDLDGFIDVASKAIAKVEGRS